MKIESVRIENFRSFKDETINLDDYNCFVGANGSGKSTVLYALNVLFRQFKDSQTDLTKLSEEDFHHKNTDKPVRITVTFTDLSEKAKEDLSHYVRQDKLIVIATAKFNKSTGTAEVEQHGIRMGFEEFKVFFEKEKEGAKADELKSIYANLKKEYPDLPSESTKANMAAALQKYEAEHPNKCVPLESNDDFYGIRGKSKLAPYVQWVFIPASKDATQEGEESKNSALGQLLERTVRQKVNFTEKVSELQTKTRDEYQALLDGEQSVLDDISKSLQARLASWAHPNISANVNWKQDKDKSVRIEEPFAYIRLGERGFEAELARFGHGLQRSYMLALLQELSQSDDENVPTLIMGIEEPEIYQHPPQARYLAETLHELSQKNTQLLLCTHSPLFIPGDNFDKIRIVREHGNPSYTTITRLLYDDLVKELKDADSEKETLKETGMVAKLYPSLNPIINEMFFCKVLILVEGPEDLAFITSALLLSGKMNNFRKNGCHIVPVNSKSNLIKPIAMAKLLGIPVYVVFDADTDKDEISVVSKHKKDNKAIFTLLRHGTEDEWPADQIIKDNCTCWKTNIGDEVSSEFGGDWGKYKTEAEKFYENPGGLNKNPLAIAKILELANNENKKSQLLTDLVKRIIDFADKSNSK